MKRNYFGEFLFSPLEIIRDDSLWPLAQEALALSLTELHAVDSTAAVLASLKTHASRGSSVEEVESNVRVELAELIGSLDLKSALQRRAKSIAGQVAPYVKGTTLLDVGCGDGLISLNLQELTREITLVDVENYVDPEVRFNFEIYSGSEPLPVHGQWDTSMLLTVLHHSADPLHLLDQVRKVTRERSIIIESVIGVPAEVTSWTLLKNLPSDSQAKYASFVDWWYNRILHTDVPVPYNFTSPDNWRRIFETRGWQIEVAVDLGIDQRLVPEHHYLFSLNPI